jgi:hypothetical protein
VVVTFACSDALSGVASCAAPVTVSTEGANQQVTGTAVDRADNAASATVTGISIDKTAPAVTYSGNAGTYTVDQTVSITCAATDGLSGIKSTTCQNVTGPASSFALGANTFSATATDRAGNVGAGSVTFTVVANPAGVSKLTTQFIQSSPKYQALTPQQKAAVDQLSAAAAQQLPALLAALPPAQKPAAIAAYDQAVRRLVTLGWLTQDQATTLITLAKAM